MNVQQIRAMSAEVLADIAPEADLSSVADRDDLREALDLDSMDFLNFVIGLGKRSGVRISDADAAKLRSIDAIVAYFSAAH